MKTKKMLVCAMLSTISICSHSQEIEKNKESDLTIGIHVRSYHGSGNFNNNNYGAYIRKGNFVIGDYYNSINKNSFYAGYIFEMNTPNVPLIDSIGLLVGGVTGYKNKEKIAGFNPMIVPSAKFLVTDDFGFRLTFIPYTDMTESNVLHLSLEKKF